MSLNKLFIFLGCLLLLAFLSCKIDKEMVQSWSFNETQFNQMENNWKEKNLLNYSFKYSVSDIIPDAITGVVTVTDGKSSVNLTINGLTSDDEGFEEELQRYAKRDSKIEFNSIDEIYSYVKSVLNNRKQNFESKNIITYKLSINYDNENSIPLLIEETVSTEQDFNNELLVGDWNEELNIKITNFTIKK